MLTILARVKILTDALASVASVWIRAYSLMPFNIRWLYIKIFLEI
jgi:hypothetical protein